MVLTLYVDRTVPSNITRQILLFCTLCITLMGHATCVSLKLVLGSLCLPAMDYNSVQLTCATLA